MYIKTTKLINLLEKVTNKTPVYEMSDARWLRKIKRENPNLLALTELDNILNDPNLPYFEAQLTEAGRKYLSDLKGVPVENH